MHKLHKYCSGIEQLRVLLCLFGGQDLQIHHYRPVLESLGEAGVLVWRGRNYELAKTEDQFLGQRISLFLRDYIM